MRIYELYGQGNPVFSFEFFPPKTDEAAEKLMTTVKELREMLAPDFVSVTYGAGGSTRGRTIDLVARIRRELGIRSMAHLTVVGHTKEELKEVVEHALEEGIRDILALRGDAPKGQERFERTPGGFGYASELICFLNEHYDVGIGGACYPEAHPESRSDLDDLHWAAHKVECGARFLITQLFFDNADYFRYVERARERGIEVPIVPGIMPVTNVGQIERFTSMCGARIPPRLHARLRRYQEDLSIVMAIGIEHAIRQCRELLEQGAPGIHFYTLNKSHATRSILAAIKEI